MKHLCHADRCVREVEPKMLFCRAHWFRLERPLQRAIWRFYRPGQEVDKLPSPQYLLVQRLAVNAVAVRDKLRTERESKEAIKLAMAAAIRAGVGRNELEDILVITETLRGRL